MARKVNKKDNRYLARLVTENRAPCAFCHREVDDEVTYGKLYAIGDIQCHYFCALLSCCLVQKGPEKEGLFGFMYRDILAELERIKKHKCSYCSRNGANLGCSVGSCRKQFHLPCGREKNAVSLFYGSYKSFCKAHAPRQKIPDHIMCKARQRMKVERKNIVKLTDVKSTEEEMVCVICYESVQAHPSVDSFWPPCCARDAWFHRSCLQRMALSAGMHYLKCPLCNDKEQFYEAVISQGYYVPDRDAAWEMEQNAFAEIYERPLTCAADTCSCPMGREHDADQGMWDIKLCLLCGSVGCHAHCTGASETTRFVCLTCTPAAPENMQALAETIEKLILQEQASATNNHGPVMPSRMSLRRTKGRLASNNRPSTSRAYNSKAECESPAQSPNIQASRRELNLNTPRKLIPSDSSDTISHKHTHKSPEKKSPKLGNLSNKSEAKISTINDSYKNSIRFHDLKNSDAPMSPMKLLESFREKVVCMGGTAMLDDVHIVDLLRNKFKKPRPLCEKKKIIDEILDGLFRNTNNMLNLKHKELVRKWSSPKKCYDIAEEEENQTPTSENQPKGSTNTAENSIQEPRINHSTPRKTTKVKDENVTDDQKNTNKYDDSQGNNTFYNSHDDSSNSTFQLPSEFIAESDDSTLQSPKRKTIEMKDSSLEISEQDHAVNIDLTKISDSKKCSFKFSRLDKEILEEENVGIDLECFKKGYLSEVDRDLISDKNTKDINLHSVIDFAIDAHFDKDKFKSKKRKLSEGNTVLKYENEGKRRKMSENDLNLSFSSDDFDIKKVPPAKDIEKLKKKTPVRIKKATNYRRRLRERDRRCKKDANLKCVKKCNDQNKILKENLPNRLEQKGKRNNGEKNEEIKQIRFNNEKVKHNDEVINVIDRNQDKLKAEKSERKNHVKIEKREVKEKIVKVKRLSKSKKESVRKLTFDEEVIKEKYKKSRRDKDLKHGSEKVA